MTVSLQQVAFRGFANPVDPTPAELRAWAYHPDTVKLQTMPPDWDLLVAGDRLIGTLFDLALDATCPARRFALHCLYIYAADGIRTKFRAHPKRRLRKLVEQAEDDGDEHAAAVGPQHPDAARHAGAVRLPRLVRGRAGQRQLRLRRGLSPAAPGAPGVPTDSPARWPRTDSRTRPAALPSVRPSTSGPFRTCERGLQTTRAVVGADGSAPGRGAGRRSASSSASRALRLGQLGLRPRPAAAAARTSAAPAR